MVTNYQKIDKVLAHTVCFQITIVGIKNMLVQAIPSMYARNTMLNMLLLCVVGLLYLRAIILMPKKISYSYMGVAIVVIVSHVFTILFFPNNIPNILEMLPRTLPYCFITSYLISEIKDLSWIRIYMNKYVPFILLFSVISSLFIYRNGHITTSTWSTYSMPLSYVTMVSVMWFFDRYFREEKIRWLICSFVGIIVIVAYGSRNPLIAIVSYVAINVFKKINKSETKHKVRYLIVAVVFCVAVMFWRELLEVFGEALSVFGISSRTVKLLTSETISSSGRDTIHSSLLTALNDHPFIGFGVLGDEVVINESAHSLYLSILSNYGYPIGIVIITILLSWNARAFKLANKEIGSLLLIYSCLVWPRGFTGGDVWSSDVLWWLIGIVCSILSYGKYEAQILPYCKDKTRDLLRCRDDKSSSYY